MENIIPTNMPNHAIQENILNALTGSSSQMPVNQTMLKTLLVPGVKMVDLVTELDTMCQSRQLQTCSGIRDGKEYVCYWIPGNIAAKSPPLY